MMKLSKLSTWFKKNPINNTILVLLALFIVMPVRIPSELANVVDTPYGMVFVSGIALCLLCKYPVIGIVSIIAAYELIRRTRGKGGSVVGFSKDYLPGEINKFKTLQKINNVPYTVEELVINSTVPYSYNVSDITNFDDSTNDTHSAEAV
jgi:hypothetical protein